MKFTISDKTSKQGVIDYLQKLPENDKRFDVSIVLHRERRSIDQNSLYWMWLALVEDETGNRKSDLHDVFRAKFLHVFEREVLGETVRELPSTTKLDTKQFAEYMKKIDVFCSSELGIVCPHPEDQFWADFESKYGTP